jgi:hypothetical protein
LAELEKASTAYAGTLVIFVDEPPTEDQLRAIEEGQRIGRQVLRVNQRDADL